MKIIAITQARYGSSRLPGKVLKEIGNKTLLSIHLERAKRSKKINRLIVATTVEPEAEAIVNIARTQQCDVYRGSVDDVLDRYYQAANLYRPDYVVRITSDCPLMDPVLMDEIIDACVKGGFDYCSNTLNPTYPDGMDVEVFTFAALQQAWEHAILQSDREHVTPYIWRNAKEKVSPFFRTYNYHSQEDYSCLRLTVDEPSDFELIKNIVLSLGDDKGWKDYVTYLNNNKEIFEINSH